MSAASVLLVLLSALLHAGWSALCKRERDPEAATVAVLAVATLTAGLAALWEGAGAFPRPAGLAWAVAAGVGEGLYFLTLGRALARAPLGLVYTVARGGAIVTVWPVSAALLGEPVTPPALAGAVLILAGLLATGATPGASARGLAWAAGSALAIAGYHLAYKQALAAAARPSALFAVSLVIALAFNLVQLPRARLRGLRAGPVVLGGVTCTAAFLVFLHALAGAGAGAVLTLRNTSVVFAQLFGRALGEPLRPRQVLGAFLVLAGAIVLGWPR